MAMLSAAEGPQTRLSATVCIVAGAVMHDSSTSAKLDNLTEAAAPGVAIKKAGSTAFAFADLTDIHTVGPVSASQGAPGPLSHSVATHTTAPAAARSRGTTVWMRQQSNTWPPARPRWKVSRSLCAMATAAAWRARWM